MTHLATHTVGLGVSLLVGGVITGWALNRLRLINATTEKSGPHSAGKIIGGAERFLIYLMIVFGHPQLLAALVAIKTLVRYPEVRAARDAAGDDDSPQRHFAEYYLVGTLVSVCFGVAVPLVAEGVYRYALLHL
ncbi:MAG: hypothetical protein CVU56_07145 [Deltaproteobacteria bacterium HGW-Deltaproteobacteria-14]|nr:MAG: hypothetical protein CVU56_07145 [Deltaproteobacteria bacterium HGW-Deltaproteobacteria-14]